MEGDDVTDIDTPNRDAGGRLAQFQAEVERLRIKGSSPTVEQRLLTAGVVLMPLGVVLVLVGWYGASGTDESTDQMSYLISGGVLGLALAVVGAALFLRYSLARYFRYWLMRLIYEERTSTDRNVEALERIERLLGDR
jgi:hypothetical protein